MRSVAAALILGMLSQDVFAAVTAADAGAAWRNSAERTAYHLPRSVVTVGASFTGAPSSSSAHRRNPSIIVIEDAHTNPSGQINLARTLDAVIGAHRLPAVFTEGSDRDVSLSALRSHGTPRQRELAVMPFLRKGELKGSEYLELTREEDFAIVGVENRRLYDRAVTLYADAARSRDGIKIALDRMDRTLNAVENAFLNPELLRFVNAVRAYERGDVSAADHLAMLTALADGSGVARADLARLERLARIRRLEKAIDPVRAAEEWAAAVRTLPASERASLEAVQVGKATRDRAEAMTAAGARLSRSLGSRARHGALGRQLRYLRAVERLDLRALIDRADRVTRQIERKLVADPRETALLDAGRSLRHLRAQSDLTLTPDGRAHLLRMGKSAEPERIAALLNRFVLDLDLAPERAILLEESRLGALDASRDFYRTAVFRDREILRRLLREAQRLELDHAVLIAGGFHTPHLTDLMRKQGIPYQVLTPQVYEETDRRRYEKLLLAHAPRRRPAAEGPGTASALITLHAADDPATFGRIKAVIEALPTAGFAADRTRSSRPRMAEAGSPRMSGAVTWGMDKLKKAAFEREDLILQAMGVSSERARLEVLRGLPLRSKLVWSPARWKEACLKTAESPGVDPRERTVLEYLGETYWTAPHALPAELEARMDEAQRAYLGGTLKSDGGVLPVNPPHPDEGAGRLLLPADPRVSAGHAPDKLRVVILLHAFGTDLWEPHLDPVTKELLGRGIAVLRINIPAHGSSSAFRAGKDGIVDWLRGWAGALSAAKDVTIDPDRIGVFGFSVGGDIALRAAGALPRSGADAASPFRAFYALHPGGAATFGSLWRGIFSSQHIAASLKRFFGAQSFWIDLVYWTRFRWAVRWDRSPEREGLARAAEDGRLKVRTAREDAIVLAEDARTFRDVLSGTSGAWTESKRGHYLTGDDVRLTSEHVADFFEDRFASVARMAEPKVLWVHVRDSRSVGSGKYKRAENILAEGNPWGGVNARFNIITVSDAAGVMKFIQDKDNPYKPDAIIFFHMASDHPPGHRSHEEIDQQYLKAATDLASGLQAVRSPIPLIVVGDRKFSETMFQGLEELRRGGLLKAWRQSTVELYDEVKADLLAAAFGEQHWVTLLKDKDDRKLIAQTGPGDRMEIAYTAKTRELRFKITRSSHVVHEAADPSTAHDLNITWTVSRDPISEAEGGFTVALPPDLHSLFTAAGDQSSFYGVFAGHPRIRLVSDPTIAARMSKVDRPLDLLRPEKIVVFHLEATDKFGPAVIDLYPMLAGLRLKFPDARIVLASKDAAKFAGWVKGVDTHPIAVDREDPADVYGSTVQILRAQAAHPDADLWVSVTSDGGVGREALTPLLSRAHVIGMASVPTSVRAGGAADEIVGVEVPWPWFRPRGSAPSDPAAEVSGVENVYDVGGSAGPRSRVLGYGAWPRTLNTYNALGLDAYATVPMRQAPDADAVKETFEELVWGVTGGDPMKLLQPEKLPRNVFAALKRLAMPGDSMTPRKDSRPVLINRASVVQGGIATRDWIGMIRKLNVMAPERPILLSGIDPAADRHLMDQLLQETPFGSDGQPFPILTIPHPTDGAYARWFEFVRYAGGSVISPDTGFSHMALVYGMPTLVLAPREALAANWIPTNLNGRSFQHVRAVRGEDAVRDLGTERPMTLGSGLRWMLSARMGNLAVASSVPQGRPSRDFTGMHPFKILPFITIWVRQPDWKRQAGISRSKKREYRGPVAAVSVEAPKWTWLREEVAGYMAAKMLPLARSLEVNEKDFDRIAIKVLAEGRLRWTLFFDWRTKFYPFSDRWRGRWRQYCWEHARGIAGDPAERVRWLWMATLFDRPGESASDEIHRELNALYVEGRKADYRDGNRHAGREGYGWEPDIRRVEIPFRAPLNAPAGTPSADFISANLILPDAGRFPGPRPIKILYHGFLGSKETPYLDAVERAWVTRGYAVLRPDLLRHGESKAAFTSVAFIKAFNRSIADFLKNPTAGLEGLWTLEGGVGIYGFSFGGNVAFRAMVDGKFGIPVSDKGIINAPLRHSFDDRALNMVRRYGTYLRHLFDINDPQALYDRVHRLMFPFDELFKDWSDAEKREFFRTFVTVNASRDEVIAPEDRRLIADLARRYGGRAVELNETHVITREGMDRAIEAFLELAPAMEPSRMANPGGARIAQMAPRSEKKKNALKSQPPVGWKRPSWAGDHIPWDRVVAYQRLGEEMVDVVLAKPDTIAVVIDAPSGLGKTTLANAFEEAWEKRMKQIGGKPSQRVALDFFMHSDKRRSRIGKQVIREGKVRTDEFLLHWRPRVMDRFFTEALDHLALGKDAPEARKVIRIENAFIRDIDEADAGLRKLVVKGVQVNKHINRSVKKATVPIHIPIWSDALLTIEGKFSQEIEALEKYRHRVISFRLSGGKRARSQFLSRYKNANPEQLKRRTLMHDLVVAPGYAKYRKQTEHLIDFRIPLLGDAKDWRLVANGHKAQARLRAKPMSQRRAKPTGSSAASRMASLALVERVARLHPGRPRGHVEFSADVRGQDRIAVTWRRGGGRTRFGYQGSRGWAATASRTMSVGSVANLGADPGILLQKDRLSPQDAADRDFEMAIEMTGAFAGRLPVRANIELDRSDLAKVTGVENTADLIKKIDAVREFIHKKGICKLIYKHEVEQGTADRLPDAPTARLFHELRFADYGVEAGVDIKLPYSQSEGQILPILSSATFAALLAVVAQMPEGEEKDGLLGDLSEYYRRLTGSPRPLTSEFLAEVIADPSKLTPIRPLRLGGYSGVMVYFQRLSRRSAEIAA